MQQPAQNMPEARQPTRQPTAQRQPRDRFFAEQIYDTDREALRSGYQASPEIRNEIGRRAAAARSGGLQGDDEWTSRAQEWLRNYRAENPDAVDNYDLFTRALAYTRELTGDEALRAGIKTEAEDFRANLPDYIRQRQGVLADTARMAEEQGVRRTREGFEGRGLLYSGLAQSGEAGLRGEIRTQLRRGQSEIAQSAEELARRKELAAAASGLEQASQLMNEAEQYYNMSMQNQIARRRAMQGLIGGIGYGIGSFIGSQNKPETPTQEANTGLLTQNTDLSNIRGLA